MKAIDGNKWKEMLNSGARILEDKKKEIDSLNVFPVPDGDTGTNMCLTFRSAAAAGVKIESNSISEIANAASMGSLMGARGNSGVILSQIMRGIAKGLDGLSEANTLQFASALQAGVDTAYKAVMKPVEGTILTVSKEFAKGALSKAKAGETDFFEVIQAGLVKGQVALAKTPEMLPVLKQAGVVDAGGEGFLTIVRGWINALEGRSSGLALQDIVEDISGGKSLSVSEIKGIMGVDSLEYPYCTEFLVKGHSMNPDLIRDELIGRGDCLLVVGTDSIVKIHIHTNNPGKILDYALRYGSLHEVQIHNMLAQNEAASHQAKGEEQGDFDDAVNVSKPLSGEKAVNPEDFKEYGIVAVAMGEGISEIFNSLGVEQVVFGGQTMNPSTYDLAEAAKKIAARNIIILPNNGNIIMAAQQVDELLEDRKVHVIPTKSIPQGIAALLGYNPDLEPDANIDNMKKAITQVSSGEVTYAVRSSQFGDLEISEGDILGLVEDKITTTGKEILEVSKKVLEEMNWRDKDLVTIIYGKDMLEEDVEVLEYWLESEKPDIEVEIYAGQQPLYYYIFGVE